jgi:tetratricopeptide (TPR) repeat protein
MRAFVFTDKALASRAGQFVWFEMNTELAKNAPLRKKLPVEALPTFFVVNPRDESVLLKWVGGMSVAQVQTMLDDGRGRFAGVVPKGLAAGADAALARADKSYGAGENAEAARGYLEALAAAPPGWNRYSRAVESALFALSMSDSNEAAALLARDAYPRLEGTTSAANVAASGLSSAIALPREHPLRRVLVDSLESATRAVLADATLPIAVDDRSGVYIALLEARQDAGDSTGARAIARAWSDYLDREAAKARTPDARAVFDSHRLSAYLELNEPERAIPMLQASERDLPNDYNPPARLAIAYRALKRWPEGLAASDRAMARAYGPRKLGFYQTRADLYVGLGDISAAEKTLAEAIAMAEAMPQGQRSERTIAALKKKLEGLGGR